MQKRTRDVVTPAAHCSVKLIRAVAALFPVNMSLCTHHKLESDTLNISVVTEVTKEFPILRPITSCHVMGSMYILRVTMKEK